MSDTKTKRPRPYPLARPGRSGARQEEHPPPTRVDAKRVEAPHDEPTSIRRPLIGSAILGAVTALALSLKLETAASWGMGAIACLWVQQGMVIAIAGAVKASREAKADK